LSYLIDLSTHVKELHHYLTLNKECRVDLQFWLTFLSDWNGVNMFYDCSHTSSHAHQVNCLISFIITKHLDRPFSTIPTVASLSHQNKMFLHFQSLLIVPGRSFVSYLIDLSTHVKELHHYLTLNKECRVDLQFWLTFLSDWNGVNIAIDNVLSLTKGKSSDHADENHLPV
jgi:hypothetical protein